MVFCNFKISSVPSRCVFDRRVQLFFSHELTFLFYASFMRRECIQQDIQRWRSLTSPWVPSFGAKGLFDILEGSPLPKGIPRSRSFQSCGCSCLRGRKKQGFRWRFTELIRLSIFFVLCSSVEHSYSSRLEIYEMSRGAMNFLIAILRNIYPSSLLSSSFSFRTFNCFDSPSFLSFSRIASRITYGLFSPSRPRLSRTSVKVSALATRTPVKTARVRRRCKAFSMPHEQSR